MSSPVARIADGHLQLPSELSHVMGITGRSMLLFEPRPSGVMISRVARFDLFKRRVKRTPSEAARLDRGTDGRWFTRCPSWLDEGTYRIASYSPRFLLIPSATDDEAADREAFWAAISDYHEHREHTKQSEAASAFSHWFAEHIISRFQPQRVLELGCGSGRNLAYIVSIASDVEVVGVEINPAAAELARLAIGSAGSIVNGSLYDVGPEIGRFDVVFTAGVLMHIPHLEVERVIDSMVSLATKAILHFELHGVPHEFDFHRYSRHYGELYERLGSGHVSYQVFDRSHPLNAGNSAGQMALLTYLIDGADSGTYE